MLKYVSILIYSLKRGSILEARCGLDFLRVKF